MQLTTLRLGGPLLAHVFGLLASLSKVLDGGDERYDRKGCQSAALKSNKQSVTCLSDCHGGACRQPQNQSEIQRFAQCAPCNWAVEGSHADRSFVRHLIVSAIK